MPSVAAVVSLFNPDDGVLANARALLGQVDTVIVVDDGSPQDPAPVLEQLATLGCTVERLGRNSGIAAALNAGIAVAFRGSGNPDYILTMDQDSLLDAGYVGSLVAAATAARAANVPVGMVGPGAVLGLPVRRAGKLNGIELGGEPIQSGLLIPASVLERLGLFQDSLFIDGVDSEFYLRCTAVGLRTIIAPEAALQHSLGSTSAAIVLGKEVSIGGQPLKVRTAAVWRYYYLFRNRILLARQYGVKFPLWTLKGFLADYRHLAIVTLLAPGRRARLANVLSGIVDGVRGVSGPRSR
ncbi:glycosyltransferase [Pseudarthrobacter cellobiosi]|uniref:glycosyltransferase n=1 Tax=Pseudarthrobacter cellobiosi TaxID=2953654 RepID=UPI00208FB110|nr:MULTISPECIES: glycosyltransferase [unclassified Pseudarthrobacter]MCO4257450.1 glycosyltransferase [Pseudarthrobacter sp. HLT1-5]MCO4274867.1 glycosyltransferase [Pseudarthrobacter sp. HLT3-5]